MEATGNEGLHLPPPTVDAASKKRQRRRRTPPPGPAPTAPTAGLHDAAAEAGTTRPVKKRVDGRGKSAASRANLKRGGQGHVLVRWRASTSDDNDLAPAPRARTGDDAATAADPAQEDARDSGAQTPPPAATAAADFDQGDGPDNGNGFADFDFDFGGDGFGAADAGADAPPESPTPDWELYRDALEQSDLVISPVGDEYYAVPLWDSKHKHLLPAFSHLSFPPSSSPLSLPTCFCNTRATSCVHTDLYHHDPVAYDKYLPVDGDDATAPVAQVVAFHRGQSPRFAFSVQQSDGYANSGKRLVVLYLRQGKMTCEGKGCRSDCEHVRLAQDWATQLGYLDEHGRADNGDGPSIDGDNSDADGDVDDARRPVPRLGAISHAVRGPPVFCRLEDDERDQAHPTISSDLRHLPSVLSLSASSRCRCGRTWGDATPEERAGVDERAAVVFGETEAVNAVIETAACSTCRSGHRRFGPDLVDVGLFNWNNSILFTREVFDSFLIEGHLSEKTLRSFVTGIEYKYAIYRVRHSFPKRDCFASAFFSFSKLLRLATAPRCPECGDQPNCVICDGSGISFPSKYLRGNVRGPPFPTTSSKRKEGVRIGIPVEALPAEEHMLSTSEITTLRTRVTAMTRERLRGSDLWAASEVAILRKMASNGTALAQAVSAYALELPSLPQLMLPPAILLLRQVISPDMVFYLVPVETFEQMATYTTSGRMDAVLLRLVPVLTDLAAAPPRSLRALFAALLVRARALYAVLCANSQQVHPPEYDPRDFALARAHEERHPNTSDASVTGAFYELPRVRDRPLYPNIKGDAGRRRLLQQTTPDDSNRGGACTKQYMTYGKSGLIGGIFGMWCKHGICIGCHVMPTSEGRDDPFSALFCYWEKAPSIVIYDYACTLAPYCMIREPEFFANTRFLVDELHAKGHTSCSPGSFLSTHMKADPLLRTINSSVAECAHSSLSRLHKPLAYMSESRAILRVQQALHIHNRMKKKAKQFLL